VFKYLDKIIISAIFCATTNVVALDIKLNTEDLYCSWEENIHNLANTYGDIKTREEVFDALQQWNPSTTSSLTKIIYHLADVYWHDPASSSLIRAEALPGFINSSSQILLGRPLDIPVDVVVRAYEFRGEAWRYFVTPTSDSNEALKSIGALISHSCALGQHACALAQHYSSGISYLLLSALENLLFIPRAAPALTTIALALQNDWIDVALHAEKSKYSILGQHKHEKIITYMISQRKQIKDACF
jgi:hypothetical protein